MENTQEDLAVMNLNGNNDSRFYVDSGAMAHMTNQGDKLKLLRLYFGTDHTLVENELTLPITLTGNASLNTPHGKLALKIF